MSLSQDKRLPDVRDEYSRHAIRDGAYAYVLFIHFFDD